MHINRQAVRARARARSASRHPSSHAFAAVAILVLLPILAAVPAAAQSANSVLCSQPVKPTCVGSDLTYEDKQRINHCRRDLDRYAEQVADYRGCLAEKRKRQQEALEALQQRFQCRADGKSDC